MTSTYSAKELQQRAELAYQLITAPSTGPSEETAFAEVLGAPRHTLDIPFPDALKPVPKPSGTAPVPAKPLPAADVVAVTYTDAEALALADALTPGVKWTDWYHYWHNFDSHFRPLIGPRGPSLTNGRLGSYYPTTIGKQNLLVMKSELHLSTDWKKLPSGEPSLPIHDLYKQIITEAKPKVFLTTGTSGGVYPSMHLGDVVVTRGAMFHCQHEFKSAPFHDQSFKSDWEVPMKQQATAVKLMQAYAANLSGSGTPPNPHCGCAPAGFPTEIILDGTHGTPKFHPILTTDFFEFGTNKNDLDKLGMAVEMDDAVLGLVCSEISKPPHWASVRNLSDPAINGALDPKQQVQCAVYYYKKYGYWTTVMSALTVWCIVAGLA
jgi:nucleoside phosphorylase